MPLILVCCGSRTGLFALGSGAVEDDAAVVIQDAATPQEEGTRESQAPLAFCSSTLGPVDSCDAGGRLNNRQPRCYLQPPSSHRDARCWRIHSPRGPAWKASRSATSSSTSTRSPGS